MFIYLKYTKHGYEISVVGDSVKTAEYSGMNVRKIIIRTLLLSGAICGIVGLLLVGAINHTLNSSLAGGRGFTAIIVSWLAKFNPLIMIVSAFGISFVTQGMKRVQSQFGITSDAVSDIMIGIIFFFIIGCEFFISYKINFNFKI